MQALVRIELFAGLLLIAAAAEAQDSTGIEFFETRIRPVLAENCYSCHGADATPLQGALRVDSRAALLSGGNGGPAIVPGKPERSLLMRALRHEDELKMPPWGKLAFVGPASPNFDQQLGSLFDRRLRRPTFARSSADSVIRRR